MTELYSQDIGGCLAAGVGAGGLDAAAYGDCLAATAPALDRLRAAHDDGSLPFLRLPARRDDLAEIAEVAERFQETFEDVIVLGTGGSSLGGRALHALMDPGQGNRPLAPEVHFLENIDPVAFAGAMENLVTPNKGEDTGVISISKSGATAETMMQTLVVVDLLRRRQGEEKLAENVVVITEARRSPLGDLADRFGIRRIEHDPGVGGRFAALSAVGLLPAAIAGLDVERIRAGAAAVLEPVLAGADPEDVPAAVGAAVSVGLARHRGVSATVMMPYGDNLRTFARWHRQLWAESLGKDGNGTTPIAALGAVDQHSQLQLYLEGPPDKMFSLVLYGCAGYGNLVAADLVEGIEGLSYLARRAVGDLFDAEGRATAETLIRNGRPTRTFRIKYPDAETMGALMMHFMLETVISADLLGVNAFDQPAVEEGKALAREYLAKAR